MFEMPPDWRVYGLDGSWTGEVIAKGYARGGVVKPTGWRFDHVHIHHGPWRDHNAPHVDVVSAPHLGETALSQLHSGLAQAGFEYGMSGTGHVSGAPVPPERIMLPLDGAEVEADLWRGANAEVAWVETVDSWVAITASKVHLSTVGLTRISDLGPLLAARDRLFGR